MCPGDGGVLLSLSSLIILHLSWLLPVPEVVAGHQLRATVTELSPWVEYEFRVLASNTIGTGEPSKPSKQARTKGTCKYFWVLQPLSTTGIIYFWRHLRMINGFECYTSPRFGWNITELISTCVKQTQLSQSLFFFFVFQIRRSRQLMWAEVAAVVLN